MAEGFSYEFGLYNNSTDEFSISNAHWFADVYWTDTSTNQVCLKIKNNSSNRLYLKTFSFSLINGSSNGVSFTDNSENGLSTTDSIATLKCHIDNIESNTVDVGKGNQSFVYSSSHGQSYWKYRPSNGIGELFPDGDESLVDYYDFTFPNEGVLFLPGDIKYIRFTCTWNTKGTHIIQIYAVNGIYFPVTYTVIWKLNGGNIDGNTEDVIDTVVEGESATPPLPVRTNYSLEGWEPSSGWVNVTKNLIFTAKWSLSAVIWRYNKAQKKWEKILSPRIYDAKTKTWKIDNSKYHIMTQEK